MPEIHPLIRNFEDALADPNARPAQKVAAGKELAKLRERQPVLDDPLGRVCRLIPCVTFASNRSWGARRTPSCGIGAPQRA
jgi:hypothetical protein